MQKILQRINIYFLNIFTFLSLFHPSYLYSLYLDSWNPQFFSFYIQNYYLKHNDQDKLINLHYMVIDPENIYRKTKPELNTEKIKEIYNTHKINIYVVYINIASIPHDNIIPKEQKIVLVIIFFAKNDENKIRKELVMKKKINNYDTIQISNKNIYKLKLKEYDDIITALTNEVEENKENKFILFGENIKLFDIILALWILIVSFMFKYLIKMGKKKPKTNYNYNSNYLTDNYFISKSADIMKYYYK